MIIFMGLIILGCGIYVAYRAIKNLTTGRTEIREDEFPPITRKKNPMRFYFSTFTCMAGGIAMIVFSVLILTAQIAKYW